MEVEDSNSLRQHLLCEVPVGLGWGAVRGRFTVKRSRLLFPWAGRGRLKLPKLAKVNTVLLMDEATVMLCCGGIMDAYTVSCTSVCSLIPPCLQEMCSMTRAG